jgi:RNA polymerase sigma factor (sigma-70 family)
MMFSIEKDLKSQMSHIKQCCGKYAFDEDERELLYSDVLEKIWKYRHKFTGTEKEFKGWVYTVTRNAYFTIYQNNKKLQTEDIDDILFKVDSPDAYDVEEDYDNKRKIEDILYTIEQRFSEKSLAIFKLKFLEDKMDDDVGEELGIPGGTVRSALHRMREYISDPSNIISKPIPKTKTSIQKAPVKPSISKTIIPKTKIIKMLLKIRDQFPERLAA